VNDDFIIIIIYLFASRNALGPIIKSTNISISFADNKGGQLNTPSLTNNNSSKSNTLCCVEICELTQCEIMCLVTDRMSVTS